MSIERRQSARRVVDLNCLLRYWPFDFMRARVCNVSATGLLVELDINAVPLHVPVQLVFLGGGGGAIGAQYVSARVVHTTPNGVGLRLEPAAASRDIRARHGARLEARVASANPRHAP